MDPLYTLSVKGASSVAWKPGKWNSSKLYVTIFLDGRKVGRTESCKSLIPTWNKEILLQHATPSSEITFQLYHDSKIKDKLLGSTGSSIQNLADQCQADQNVSLELRLPPANGVVALITIKIIQQTWQGAVKQLLSVDTSRLDGAIPENITNVVDGITDLQGESSQSASVASLEHIVGQVGFIVKITDKVLGIIDGLATIHPYALFAWQVLSSLYKLFSKQVATDAIVLGLIGKLAEVYSFVEDVDATVSKLRRFDDLVSQILIQTLECAIFIREYIGHGFARRMAGQLWSGAQEKAAAFSSAFDALRTRFDSTAITETMFVSIQTASAVDKLVNDNTLKKLRPLKNNGGRSECLSGTREEVLKETVDWVTDSTQTQRILWLHGGAGVGKSTIARTVARYFRDLKRCGRLLSFDRAFTSRDTPLGVIRTLAHHLAVFNYDILTAIDEVLVDDETIVDDLPSRQFTRLLLNPLSKFSPPAQGPIVIVIDALDECGTAQQRSDLLRVISQKFIELPPHVRIIITSRDEDDIVEAFGGKEHVKPVELTPTSSKDDVTQFIRYSISDHVTNGYSRQARKLLKTKAWPPEEDIEKLAEHSGGLFVWASTVLQMLFLSETPTKTLELILSQNWPPEFGIYQLYETVLRSASSWHSEETCKLYNSILGVICIAREPITDQTVDHLLELEGIDKSAGILGYLGAILQWHEGGVIRALHTSFWDYLTSHAACGDCPWFIDVTAHHRFMLHSCLRVMRNGLRFNICHLETSYFANYQVSDLPDRIKKFIPDVLLYSCQYWAQHLPVAINSDGNLLSEVRCFMSEQLLFWLEILSICNRFFVASPSMTILKQIFQSNDSANKELADLAAEVVKFLAIFGPIISQSAPHLYISAVPLWPQNFYIQCVYGHMFKKIVRLELGDVEYLPSFQRVLAGHTKYVNSVAFSPDGTRVVSGSHDDTVRIWDAETGSVVAGPFEGHTNYVTSVAFSPDGTHVVSGSSDKTVRIWDAETGSVVAGPFEGHRSWVTSVAFSPDGTRVVSGSHDDTVRIWDAETGSVVAGPFEGHRSWVTSVAFSPDGTHVVSRLRSHLMARRTNYGK